jgi:phage tail sheath protein FI
MPGSYLHPGVYVEEVPSAAKPIEAVGTSTAVFIGYTEKGDMDTPILISDWSQYNNRFGGILKDETSVSGAAAPLGDPMGHAVYAFFQNGGGKAYIVRTTSGSPDESEGADSNSALTFTAVNEGTWGDDLVVRVTSKDTTDAANDSFIISIGTGTGDDFVVKEMFTEATLTDTDPEYIKNVINEVSDLVTVEVTDANVGTARTAFNGATDGITDIALDNGDNGSQPTKTEYQKIFTALEKYRDISIVLLPGQYWDGSTGKEIIEEGIAHCEKMANRMIIFDPEPAEELENEKDVQDLSLSTSTYAVLYYPWAVTGNPHYNADTNPGASRTVMVSPAAYAAGMWAKTDARRGVWKAPAGVEAGLLGISALEFVIENAEQDYLNPQGVNAFRKLPNYGTVIWGTRTRSTKANPEWRYVPVRRTAIFIEESLYNGIQWAVFEPNDHRLWSALRTNIDSFMNGLFRVGAFQGEKASDAYFVRCGLGTTMTQGDIDRGQVIVEVGFAPLKPAEFVIVRIQQKVGQQ